MRRALLLPLAALPLAGCMAPPSDGGAAMELLSGVLALAVVLGLAWVSLRLLRRFNVGVGAAPGAPALRFLRALPLGPRERLVVVVYEGEVLLLGVSAGQVTLLDRRPEAATEGRDNPS